MGFLRLIFENSFFPLCLKWFGILRKNVQQTPGLCGEKNHASPRFFCTPESNETFFLLCAFTTQSATFTRLYIYIGKKTIAWENGKILNNIKLSPELPSLFF